MHLKMFCLVLFCNLALGESTIVSTPKQAIDLARSAWASIYSKTNRKIFSPEAAKLREPYDAKLVDGIWVVQGTIPAGFNGEVLITKITQKTGEVSVEARNVGKKDE
jgi:hypothetical protein